MWASLETWLIGDGQVREVPRGGVLRDCGLRLNCSSLHATEEAREEIREVPVDDASRVRYQLTGRCQSVAGPMTALIAMPGWLTSAEPETFRVVEGAIDSPAFEPWSDEFRPPAPGRRVAASGWLAVVADHEWDAFAIPDARMDWRIKEIKLLEHQMVPAPGKGPRSWMYGPVVRSTHVDQLSQAADAMDGSRYLVDLLPARRPDLPL